VGGSYSRNRYGRLTFDGIAPYRYLLWHGNEPEGRELNDEELGVLAWFLDNGGRLLMSIPEPSDALVGSWFWSDYLGLDGVPEATTTYQAAGREDDAHLGGVSLRFGSGEDVGRRSRWWLWQAAR